MVILIFSDFLSFLSFSAFMVFFSLPKYHYQNVIHIPVKVALVVFKCVKFLGSLSVKSAFALA